MDADTQMPAQPRRRWFRFSLRTLLIVLSVLSVPLGWVGWNLKQVRREQATITWVEELGGRVPGLSWYGDRVGGVNLNGTSVSDLSPLAKLKILRTLLLHNTQVSDLRLLTELKSLETLGLGNTQVSDLSPLTELKSLERLYLSNTQVSDLSPLAELKSLNELHLEGTQVNDLSPLAELKNLTKLYLNNTQVSDLSPLAGRWHSASRPILASP